MQLALGALGALGGSAAAGTAAAATGAAAAAGTAAATTAATAATSSISAASILKGVVGVASALTSIAGANAQAEQFEMRADDNDAQAEDEEAKGMQRSTNIKRQMLRALGENEVKFAASGQLVGEGVAQENQEAIAERAVSDISIDRADTQARAALLRARAEGWRRVASRTRSIGGARGLIGAAGSAAGMFG